MCVLYLGGVSYLVDESVLVPGLHHSVPVLPQCGHNAKDINPGLSLQDTLEANVTCNEDSSSSYTSRAVHHSWSIAISKLHFSIGNGSYNQDNSYSQIATWHSNSLERCPTPFLSRTAVVNAAAAATGVLSSSQQNYISLYQLTAGGGTYKKCSAKTIAEEFITILTWSGPWLHYKQYNIYTA